ncbi:MAG: hypothetical protein WC824_13590 [Bacteroidota bacterium]|jgi:hypothetical protein
MNDDQKQALERVSQAAINAREAAQSLLSCGLPSYATFQAEKARAWAEVARAELSVLKALMLKDRIVEENQ